MCADPKYQWRSPDALKRNRLILETLHRAGFKLGVVSNFYGNVEVLCQEFGYSPCLTTVLDSAVVGLSKPNPEFFQLAAERLGLNTPEIAFVGDSFERDIVPAKSIGMTTYWVIGHTEKKPNDPSMVDGIVHHLGELLELTVPASGRIQ